MALMKHWKLMISAIAFSAFSGSANASQATTTSISITGQKPAATPFINYLDLTISNTSVLRNIQFTIEPKPGSVTRPLSATYSASYLESRGYLNSQTGQITLPIFGLYAGYSNDVLLNYSFTDGSSKQQSVVVTTSSYADSCGFNKPIVVQARTQNIDLSYDYLLIKSACNTHAPTIIDTDGAIRWVGDAGIASFQSTFWNNGVYLIGGTRLFRLELDGAVSVVGPDYASVGIADFYHNIDYGKTGLILDADTPTWTECVNLEVDKNGHVIKTWNLAEIISAAMKAGGDNPSQFVYQSPNNWFHNNSTTYRKSDNSLIVSSRENFVICLDYDTAAIKWILGDPTKKWYQFPSLRKYALMVAPGGVPPIGQHSVSITHDDNLLLLDNGTASIFFLHPAGTQRNYAAPRKYQLDLQTKVASEIWNYTRNQSVDSPYCGSVYEDAPFNYLIDYAVVGEKVASGPATAEIVGLNAAGKQIFDYEYSAPHGCDTAFNAIPIHLEQLAFFTTTKVPQFWPPAGTLHIGASNYASYARIGIATDTPQAMIRFTADGSTPTAGSEGHGQLIESHAGIIGNLGVGTYTVKAIAFANGLHPSPVVTAIYTIKNTADPATVTANPVIQPDAGSYDLRTSDQTGAFRFNAACANRYATLLWTNDGSTPTFTGTGHGSAMANLGASSATLDFAHGTTHTYTIKVVAKAPGLPQSNVITAVFTLID
jgi:arylsulfate sulfotransferase